MEEEEVRVDEDQACSDDRGTSLKEPGPPPTQQTPPSCCLCGRVLTAPGCGLVCGPCLDQAGTSSETRERLINRLKEMKTKASPDKRISILRCLVELRDQSAHQQILDFLSSFERLGYFLDKDAETLSETDCSALADLLRMSEEVLEEFTPLKYRTTSSEGFRKLVPAVSNCRQANLEILNISKSDLELVASALRSSPSHLTLLDLSQNPVVSSEMQVLSEGLQSPNCRLETLRLSACQLTESSCSSLASALKANPSHLRVLDLNWNSEVTDAGLQHLCGFLQSPDCRLESLRLYECELTEVGCSSLVSALKSNPSHLKVLDFQDNTELRDTGVERLCDFLRSPDCRLEMLGLSSCEITSSGCCSLASALMENPSHLRELVLGYNTELKDPGVERLCGFLQSPDCHLEILRLYLCGLSKSICSSLASAIKANPSHLRELGMSDNCLNRSDLQELRELQQSPDCRLEEIS